MKSTTTKIITRSGWTVLIVFVCRCLIAKLECFQQLQCNSFYDYFGAAGESIAIAVILLELYDGVLWRLNPLDKTPRLMGKYSGTIEYDYNGQKKRKNTTVKITQTSVKVKVKIITNETTSNTITSTLIEENNEYVLYYTYITNPKSRYSDENPMQHGTCRLVQINKNQLEGKYWTSRRTIGDIKLTRIAE